MIRHLQQLVGKVDLENAAFGFRDHRGCVRNVNDDRRWFHICVLPFGFAYSEYTKTPIEPDGCCIFHRTHRSSFGTLPKGAGCRAVNELVSRALFIGIYGIVVGQFAGYSESNRPSGL